MSKKQKIFFSYSSKDKEFVLKLKNALEQKDENGNSYLDFKILIDEQYIRTGDKFNKALFINEINRCDIFLMVISNASLKSKWVENEYKYAIAKNRNKNFKFIPLLCEDLDASDNVKLPFKLKELKYIDFRYPAAFLKNLNTLLLDISQDYEVKNEYKSRIESLIYKLAIDPNIEVVRLKKIIESSLEEKLEVHFEPMRKDISMIAKLNQASERIMTLEAIAEAEKKANDEIWIITTHLFNDLYDDEIKISVKQNLKNKIKYKYFIPRTQLINKRKKEYIKAYKGFKRDTNFFFINLDEENQAIMPFAEVVIYDPHDHMNIWGYVQLNYDDRTTGKDSVFLRIPQRNLFPLMELLKKISSEKEVNKKININKNRKNRNKKKYQKRRDNYE